MFKVIGHPHAKLNWLLGETKRTTNVLTALNKSLHGTNKQRKDVLVNQVLTQLSLLGYRFESLVEYRFDTHPRHPVNDFSCLAEQNIIQNVSVAVQKLGVATRFGIQELLLILAFSVFCLNFVA